MVCKNATQNMCAIFCPGTQVNSWGRSGLHSEFWDNHDYVGRACLKNKAKQTNKNG